jgi:1,2-dihydroxy-3-keto-5-methylthiopentene dioxygenase
MAVVSIPPENRRFEAADEIREFLAPYGICYAQWELTARVDPAASSEEILAAYAPEIERLIVTGGYVTADVIDVTRETPGLDAMIEKFNKEHRHTEDEVRFIVKGRGVFHIHADDERVFSIQLEAGDWINVPRGTRHWFDLCEDRTIRAIRLFQDKAGWTPHYVEQGVHSDYIPVCWGPAFVDAAFVDVAAPRVRPIVL